MDVPATNILSNIKYYTSSILIVMFLDFHSTKQGLPPGVRKKTVFTAQ